jgi:maltokinase
MMRGILMTDLRPEDLGGETGRRLLEYIRKRRWFGQKSLDPETITVLDILPLDPREQIYIAIVEIGFHGMGSAYYSVPLSVSMKEYQGTVASIDLGGMKMFLQDAFLNPDYTKAMILGIASEMEIGGMNGTMKFFKTSFLKMPEFRGFETIKSEQSNSSSIVDRSIILKNYRYLQNGENPDLEMTLALSVRSSFRNVPRPMGYAIYEGKGMKLYLACSWEFLDGSVDAWTYYTERFISLAQNLEDLSSFKEEILRLGSELGRITGSMHRSLSLMDEDAFRPEPLQKGDLTGILNESMEYMMTCFKLLRPYAEKNAGYVERLLKIGGNENLKNISERMISGITVSHLKKIRVHGDYHLGQILIWKDDFYIIDFEGEPVRSMEERREKQSPMKDLAGIIRSMDYLISYVVLGTGNKKLENEREILLKETREIVVDSYKRAFTGYSEILPGNSEKFNELLDIYILEKSSYELLYEINNRPSWIEIPLVPLVNILEISRSSRKENSGKG